jgi:hypothetical protein
MKTTNSTPETTEKKVRKTSTIPVKQSDILNLAESIVKKWEKTPEITLLWMKFADFKTLVQDFRDSLEERIQVGSSRQSTTKLLKNLDTALNEAVEELKIAILGKFGKKDGKAYYSEFGISKVSKSFKLPNDRNQRQQAMVTLIEGLEKHQLTVTKYPLQFFKDAQTQFNVLMNEAKDIDSSVSAEVGTKNELIKKLEKVLNALIWIIKGNYPDTYQAELRAWGFQKEKY